MEHGFNLSFHFGESDGNDNLHRHSYQRRRLHFDCNAHGDSQSVASGCCYRQHQYLRRILCDADCLWWSDLRLEHWCNDCNVDGFAIGYHDLHGNGDELGRLYFDSHRHHHGNACYNDRQCRT